MPKSSLRKPFELSRVRILGQGQMKNAALFGAAVSKKPSIGFIDIPPDVPSVSQSAWQSADE